MLLFRKIRLCVCNILRSLSLRCFKFLCSVVLCGIGALLCFRVFRCGRIIFSSCRVVSLLGFVLLCSGICLDLVGGIESSFGFSEGLRRSRTLCRERSKVKIESSRVAKRIRYGGVHECVRTHSGQSDHVCQQDAKAQFRKIAQSFSDASHRNPSFDDPLSWSVYARVHVDLPFGNCEECVLKIHRLSIPSISKRPSIKHAALKP